MGGTVNKFNRGEVTELVFARDDVSSINNSCALIENFMPVRTGPMMFRPGTEYLGDVPGSTNNIPFVAAVDDTAILEFSNNKLRVWVDDELITRTSVTSTITNGTFDSNISGWTDSSGVGATFAWLTGGYASLTGTTSTNAEMWQTFGTTQTGAEHAVRVVVLRAEVYVRIGTSGAGSYDIYDGTLGPGTHSLVFTPDAATTITFGNRNQYAALIDSVAFETTGVMELPTSMGSADLSLIRDKQSADVVYIDCGCGNPPVKIERRGVKSWSVADYLSPDGPFEAINNTNITIAPGALSGDTTLTASDALFSTDHVGALFKVGSAGQEVSASVNSGVGAGTGSIMVTGVGSTRGVTLNISGTFVATATLQRSSDNLVWDDVWAYTGPEITEYNDTFDNSIFYYRLWVKAGDWTSGTVVLGMNYQSGSIEGIARVTGYTSTTVVPCQVLTDFGSTDATKDWYEGSWSAAKGYPSAVEIVEGRLWHAGKNRIWGSVSDAYDSFDRSIEGNSASIFRTIGYGPVDSISWLVESTRLLMGLASDEVAVRSTSLGEILTPTNTNLKSGSNRGSAPISPLRIDDRVYFVQRSGLRVLSLGYSISNDVHSASDLTMLHPKVCSPGVKKIVFTREPETRIYVLLTDGEVRIYMFDLTEEVTCWSRVTAADSKTIDDIVVLPAADEDRVYLVIDGKLTKMALFSEVAGGNISKHFDLFKTYTSPGLTITGLPHDDDDVVTVWADGQDRGTYTVASGSITVGSSWTNVVVGLAYEADYISNKLTGYGNKQSVLTKNKRVVDTGLIMKDYAPNALKVGPTEALMKYLPGIENGTAASTSTLSSYDELPFEFDGEDETDPRVYMRATGPCTILALTYEVFGGSKNINTPQQEG